MGIMLVKEKRAKSRFKLEHVYGLVPGNVQGLLKTLNRRKMMVWKGT
jgi:hypothetical protein